MHYSGCVTASSRRGFPHSTEEERLLGAPENPFVTDGPVHGADLCGREAALEALGRASASLPVVAVVGEPGAGFTSLVATFVRRRRGDGAVLRVDATLAEDGDAVASRARAAWAEAGEPEEALLLLDGVGRLGVPPGPERLLAAHPARGPVVALGPSAGALAAEGVEAELLRLDRIPFAAWLPFTLERFLRTDRWIGDDHVAACVDRTGGHPRHTPALLAEVWRRAGQGRVGPGTIEAAWSSLLGRSRPALLSVLAGLTANQRRVLRGLALEADAAEGIRPYSSGFLDRHGLASPSSVQRCLESLEQSWHVVEDSGDPRVRDPLLGAALRRWSAEGAAPGR